MNDYHGEIDGLWNLHDDFTVEQAAALIAGYDPGKIELCSSDTSFEQNFFRLYPAKSALVNAIIAGKLRATIRSDARQTTFDEWPRHGEGIRPIDPNANLENTAEYEGAIIFSKTPNWGLTTIDVADLKVWLRSRGMRTGFFFPDETGAPDYMNPEDPRYAPKLAAAVMAWRSVTDSGAKSPKQALMKWLREHAREFDLSDEDGKPNETGIEEVAKVANWQPGGGAAKTPGG